MCPEAEPRAKLRVRPIEGFGDCGHDPVCSRADRSNRNYGNNGSLVSLRSLRSLRIIPNLPKFSTLPNLSYSPIIPITPITPIGPTIPHNLSPIPTNLSTEAHRAQSPTTPLNRNASVMLNRNPSAMVVFQSPSTLVRRHTKHNPQPRPSVETYLR